jgi:ADP-ribose pyrophosphatase
MARKAERRVLYKGRYLSFIEKGGWEYAERNEVTETVAIIAVTKRCQIVLVEQFRPPIGQPVVELPAGLAGDTPGAGDEAPEEAAKRELLEETGYWSERLTFLTRGPTSAGLTSEQVTFFWAHGPRKVQSGGGCAGESIRVHLVRLRNARGWLRKQAHEGKAIDPKVYAGLYFALVGSPKPKLSRYPSDSV